MDFLGCTGSCCFTPSFTFFVVSFVAAFSFFNAVAVVAVACFVSSVAFFFASVFVSFFGLGGVTVVAFVRSVLSVAFALLIVTSWSIGFGASVVPGVFAASAFVVAVVVSPVVTFGLQTIY
jgi:hypothetical protein